MHVLELTFTATEVDSRQPLAMCFQVAQKLLTKCIKFVCTFSANCNVYAGILSYSGCKNKQVS